LISSHLWEQVRRAFIFDRKKKEMAMQMNRSPVAPWMVLGDVLLAATFGVLIFVFLNIASFGVLATMATVAVLFLVFASLHYFAWGQTVPTSIEGRRNAALTERPVPEDLIAVELTEAERLELIALLEQAVPDNKSLKEGGGVHQSRQRELLDKLRMYGA
jgi:hypothetical protein